jgi:hypothetical protein
MFDTCNMHATTGRVIGASNIGRDIGARQFQTRDNHMCQCKRRRNKGRDNLNACGNGVAEET